MKHVLLSLVLFFAFAFAQELEIHFIDVGQGDSVFIRAPTGQTLLYDGGPRNDPAIEYLESIGVSSLDLVVVSHPDADHIRGLIRVVQELQPRFFMDNGLPATTQVYGRLIQAVADAGSSLLEPTGQQIGFGDAIIQVIPPPGKESWGRNNNSVGLIVSFGEFQLSLTGDAEREEFNWWVTNVPELLVDVDVHKSSHHGSANGDTSAAVLRFSPEVVVIGVGEGNTYGHPTDATLSRYQAIGATVYRTDLHGTVVIRANLDGTYTITTEKAVAVETPPSVSEQGTLQIACVLYNPVGRDDENEVVTLVASGIVDVTDWRLEDLAGNRLDLPSRTLVDGEALGVRIPGRAMWNNDGDTVFLFNASDQLVDSLVFTGGGRVSCVPPQ